MKILRRCVHLFKAMHQRQRAKRLCDLRALEFCTSYKPIVKFGLQLAMIFSAQSYALGDSTKFDEDQLKAEIAEIVTSDSGGLIRWNWRPNVAFVSEDPADFESFSHILDEVNASIRLQAEPLIGSVKFTRLSDFLVGSETNSFLKPRMEPSFIQLNGEMRSYMFFYSNSRRPHRDCSEPALGPTRLLQDKHH